MKLTGKAKKKFEDWYESLHYKFDSGYTGIISRTSVLYQLPLSMQWGVYVDWADSLGYMIGQNTHMHPENDGIFKYYVYKDFAYLFADDFKTRLEGQQATIEAFDNLLNNKE